ncbi:MAG: hypothetical protein A2747_03345 [Candidatus Yonathbacteria bacterium RIFCSPHIGHO2_01_FULL_44_41]|nr:MAG: hypothetical protein A2747_03345 [Candidatus Yonathbacteria bacterium RIFCSPHIGHO2_01_FULL_44_41]OHA82236.1 MAG: hypothetical protein A3B06_01950 [Candidatus Yonathbacteria bacterium RIFCSPLOWO2_01_FULL_43_20]
MTPLTLQILIITLIAVTLALIAWVFVLERRIKKLLAGKNAQSLEGVISTLGDDIRALEKFQEDTTSYLTLAEKRIKRSIQGVETIRFNAFKGNGEGGNQSFAIALLSEDGDGAVISSLFARDRMSIFAKPVKNFASSFEMTEEEADAVKRATR